MPSKVNLFVDKPRIYCGESRWRDGSNYSSLLENSCHENEKRKIPCQGQVPRQDPQIHCLAPPHASCWHTQLLLFLCRPVFSFILSQARIGDTNSARDTKDWRKKEEAEPNFYQLWDSWSCVVDTSWMEKEMATHSSILAWRIPMDTGAWGHRVGHKWSDLAADQGISFWFLNSTLL